MNFFEINNYNKKKLKKLYEKFYKLERINNY